MSLQLHNAIGWLLVIATLALIGFVIPGGTTGELGNTIGSSYLIFFFHFPSAVNCLNLFVLAGVFSALYLFRRRNPDLDLWAAASIEVGVLACTVTLITGSIWAKAAWNMFWDFKDKRLMAVAVMWFTYLGYLALRTTIEDPEKRARFSAVFGLIAAINTPVVYFSIKWWGAVRHPASIDLAQSSMIWTRWFGTLAFAVLYLAMMRHRVQIARLNRRASELEESFARTGI